MLPIFDLSRSLMAELLIDLSNGMCDCFINALALLYSYPMCFNCMTHTNCNMSSTHFAQDTIALREGKIEDLCARTVHSLKCSCLPTACEVKSVSTI
jgi:hypothetical protein